jgi:cytochrome c oxidase accessory protein FixG
MTTVTSEEEVLSTLRADGSRRWIMPRLSIGRFYRRRQVVAYALMVLFFALPFLRINNMPAVLLDVPHRRFTILGYTFLPTDTVLLALFMIGMFVTIFLMTALLGRLWCGWACPQTVYMEFLYRPLERLFNGTLGRGGAAIKTGPGRKIAYFFAALAASLIPAHTFLAYFVGVEQLRHWIFGSPLQHPAAFLIVAATTLLMLFDFYYFREQLCMIACPYGRFQSVLLDAWSMIVSYDKRRGEPRGKLVRLTVGETERAVTRGDCIDCRKCVTTCPTGIDIRNGLQMECVSCTQCIDACDSVMDAIGKPRGLIRYSSQAVIDRGEKHKWLRPRVVLYPLLLLLVATLLVVTFAGKGDADVLFTRTTGNPYMRLEGGRIANSLRVKITNRTDKPATYELSVVGTDDAQAILPEKSLTLAGGQSLQEPFIVAFKPRLLKDGSTFVTLRVSSGGRVLRDVPVKLLGPGGGFTGEKHEH